MGQQPRSFKVKCIPEYSWIFNQIILDVQKRGNSIVPSEIQLKNFKMSSVRLKVVLWSCEVVVLIVIRIVVELFVAAL